MTKNKDNIYFSKLHSDAKIPTKRIGDGCYDVYACFDEDYIKIAPNEIKLIPTKIASAFSHNYRFAVRERGSSGTKGLSVRAGQIDSGYRGEWFIPINNTTKKPIYITKTNIINKDITSYPYEKAIAQCALEEVPQVNITEIPYEELLEFESERGTGKLGSSGK